MMLEINVIASSSKGSRDKLFSGLSQMVHYSCKDGMN